MPSPSRRGEILRAAAKLFADRGFAGVSTRDIAREAGVASPSIYKHFASLDDLTVEALRVVTRERIADYQPIFALACDPRERLKTITVATISGFEDNPIAIHLYQQILSQHEGAALDMITALWFEDFHPRMRALIAEVDDRVDAAFCFFLITAFAVGCAMYMPSQDRYRPLTVVERDPVTLAQHALASALPGIDWSAVASRPIAHGRLASDGAQAAI